MPVDPGTHRIVVVQGARTREVVIVAREGEHARRVEVVLPDTPRSAASTPAPTNVTEPSAATKGEGANVPAAAIALGAVGVVGIGAFAWLGLDGAAEYRRLRDTCGTACAPDDVSRVRTKFAVADVALGVGVVSLAAAAILYVVDRNVHARVARGMAAPFAIAF